MEKQSTQSRERAVIAETALAKRADSELPVLYTEAVAALAECRNLDEAATFDDAAEALAAWSKIYNDDEAGRQARQLRLHAHRRMGQLAREIAPLKGRKGGGRQPGPVAKLREHGLSRHGAVAANHLAKMPEKGFLTLVDQDFPPAPTSVTRRIRDPLKMSGLSQQEAERLAAMYNLPVDEIQIRYVEGLRGDELVESGFVPKTDEWVTTQEVSELLSTSYGTLCSLSVGDKCPIQRKPWGKRATSMRGCGALWLRSDVDLIKRIRKDLCGSLSVAFRVLRNVRMNGWELRPPAQKDRPR